MGKDKSERNDPTAVDGNVMDALQQISADVKTAIKLQKKDPDAKTDPDDAKVSAALDALQDGVTKAILCQSKDGAADARAQVLSEVRSVAEAVQNANVVGRVADEIRTLRESVTVVHEPRVYTENGQHSYFRDLSIYQLGFVSEVEKKAATERLTRHAAEVRYEADHGDEHSREYHTRLLRSARGRVEERAPLNTTTDGAFVTPIYMIDKWIVYRSPDRSFTNQTTILPLPPYGMQFNIPSFTSAASGAEQVLTGGAASINYENSGVNASTPSGSDVTVAIGTFAGVVPISQQLFDRAGFEGTGGTFDSIIIQQSQSQMFASIDAYLIAQALASATAVNQSTAATITQFYLDLATARNQLADAAGVKLPGTHVFSTSDFSGWLFSQVDTEGRPLLVPDAAAIVSRDGDDKYAGWLGAFLPGNLKYFSNDNLPTAAPGPNTTILVGSPADMLVWAGDIVPFTAQQTYAADLSVLCGLRQYVSATVRHAAAFSYITGTGYPNTLV